MNDVDLYLGGILVSPEKCFQVKGVPYMKGFRNDIYLEAKRQYLTTGTVDIAGVYTEVRKKHPTVSVGFIQYLVTTYLDYRAEKEYRAIQKKHLKKCSACGTPCGRYDHKYEKYLCLMCASLIEDSK